MRPSFLTSMWSSSPGPLADVADRDARRPVAIGQARQTLAPQDVADRRARNAPRSAPGGAVRSRARGGPARIASHLLGRQRSGRAAAAGSRHPRGPPGPVAVASPPFRRRLATHARRLGGPRDRPPSMLHPVDQQLPAEHRQFRPTMIAESPLFGLEPDTPNRRARALTCQQRPHELQLAHCRRSRRAIRTLAELGGSERVAPGDPTWCISARSVCARP